MSSRCPACDGGDFQPAFTGSDRLYRTSSRQFQVVQCNRCGLMQLASPPPPAELGAYYPKNYWFTREETVAGKLGEIYRRLVLRDHVRFVQRALKESARPGPVLDVGCGGGLFLRLLRDRGYRVVGLDASTEAARVAWTSNQVPAI